MKRPSLLAFMLLTLSLPAWGQFTLTTGTITDPNGAAYALGTGRAQFNGSPNSVFTATGQPIGQQTIPLTLDATGTFTNVSLADNTKISPPGSTWVFSFTSAGGGVTPQVSYTATNPVTISGTSQNVSVQASAGSKALPASGLSCAQVSGCVTNPVSSFNTRTGAVVPATGDYTAAKVTGAMPHFASYTFFLATDSTCTVPSASGTSVCARNNSTGVFDFNGTDAAAVINSVINANSSTCGTLYFKNGDYLLNSATLESSSTNILLSGSLYYSIAIPANAGTNVYCQWHFEGEAAPYIANVAGVLPTAGVFFDVTSTAVTAAAPSTNMIAALWHRPDTANSIGNDVFVKNIAIRFPNNTRGNECAFCLYEAGTVDYENTLATLNTNVGTPLVPVISPATAGTNRMIGYTSTQNAHDNWQHFKETWAVGYDICYDIESEHGVLDSVNGLLCSNMAFYGRILVGGSTIVHPGVWLKVTDQENIKGITLGTAMAPGSEFDIFGYDIELANGVSNASFVRTADLTETNPGYTSGIITYQAVTQNSGVTNRVNLWTGGGSQGINFQMSQGDTRVNYQNPIMIDNFAGPNATPSLSPGWIQFNAGVSKNCDITSNTVRVHSTAGACGVAFQGQNFNNDQFASVKVTAVDSTGSVGASVRAISTFLTVRTMYKYVCSTSGGVVTNRAIYKFINNTPTLLTQTTGASGCSANDVIELDAIGTSLYAYYNGALDLVTTDSSITTGYPGAEITESTTIAGTSFSNWTGGSLPTKTGSDSIYAKPAVHPMYLSNGTAPTPTGTGACATITTQVPSAVGSQAGSLKCTGTTGASTITLTFPAAQAAPNGWRCSADDETTVADRPNQTSYTVTTCVLTTAATAQNDVIVWSASPF